MHQIIHVNLEQKMIEKKSVEINTRGTYNTNSQIKFKTSTLKLRLCDYSDCC